MLDVILCTLKENFENVEWNFWFQVFFNILYQKKSEKAELNEGMVEIDVLWMNKNNFVHF